MKVVNLSIPSSLRLGLTLTIVLMVISSPVVMLVNPAIAAPPSAAAGDVTAYAPSTISQGGASEDKEFTTQAALSLAKATQTSNIVDSKAYYDISFTTSTAGVIKFLTIAFPPGTNVGSAVLIEAEGIGTGTIAPAGSVATGQRLTYTVTNAVNVPALTKIRVEVADVNNPPVASTSLTVTITTRNSADGVIDGPTPTSAYNMKQIGTGQIADGAVTTPKIADQSVTVNKIQGFNKLIPGVCSGSLPSLGPGQFASFGCFVPESVQGEGIFATWCGVRVPPSPVLINAATQDENVNFGFENPSSVATAAQPVVHACFLISNPPNGIS